MVTFQWRQGRLVPAPPVLPDGSYTTFRTHGARGVLRLAQHVRRLVDSATELGWAGPLDAADVRAAVSAALSATGFAESRLRLTFAPPTLFVGVQAFERLPEALYREGAAAVTVTLERERPHAKDTRFLAEAERTRLSLPPGVHEGLLVSAGAILEGLSSNFFAVLDGQLRTEPERVLRGVTRSVVLELAGDVLPVVLEPVCVADVPRLAEAFITSVSRGILAVARIDGQRLANGRPGPLCDALRRRFEELLAREVEWLP
jgi:branched-chain amino acid aminotransferase